MYLLIPRCINGFKTVSNAVLLRRGQYKDKKHMSTARLLPAGVGEHAAVLEDEQRLHHMRLLGAALLRRRPAQRLQLHLPVHARKAAALLQHRLRARATSSSRV